MKTVQWQMKEDFVFPESTGTPTGTESVRVTPRFTIDRSGESVRMTGIYHLAVNVEFDLEVPRTGKADSAILIDDVELNGNLGYFEYAVPFNIDLPPEANDPLNIATANAQCEMEGQGAIAVIWEVQCSYREIIEVQEDSSNPKQKEPNTEETPESPSNVAAEVAETEEVVEDNPAPEHTVKYENVSIPDREEDETLSFIAGLEDGISTTVFRSNNVSVQGES
ncbi:hypothetical protein [Sporosarcina jiandibaonis]|uniref:hypothetical protein n=1 Tax=Sporosarcina jiandibaonis TaxID=2715535 RepID=UPI001556918E|nr:hypothetical protein [Sporosarcina jiandibaonis]